MGLSCHRKPLGIQLAQKNQPPIPGGCLVFQNHNKVLWQQERLKPKTIFQPGFFQDKLDASFSVWEVYTTHFNPKTTKSLGTLETDLCLDSCF